MSPALFALVAGAGGLGAVARALLDGAITRRSRPGLGTFLINVTGSFVLGCVTGWASRHVLDAGAATVLGVGFLGGYTTFSTAMWETLDFLRRGRWTAAGAHALGMLVLGVAAAWAGLACAS